MIFQRVEAPALLAFAKGQDCQMMSPECNHDSSTVVACHIPAKFMASTSGKNSDFCIFFGCSGCHHWYDITERGSDKADAYALLAMMKTQHILHQAGLIQYKSDKTILQD